MNGDDHAGKRSCPVRTPFSSSRYTCSRDSPVLHCGERAGLARNREAKARTKRGASLRPLKVAINTMKCTCLSDVSVILYAVPLSGALISIKLRRRESQEGAAVVGHCFSRVKPLEAADCLLLPDVKHRNTPMKIQQCKVHLDVLCLSVRWCRWDCQSHENLARERRRTVCGHGQTRENRSASRSITYQSGSACSTPSIRRHS